MVASLCSHSCLKAGDFSWRLNECKSETKDGFNTPFSNLKKFYKKQNKKEYISCISLQLMSIMHMRLLLDIVIDHFVMYKRWMMN
jgi:hypothetical protein